MHIRTTRVEWGESVNGSADEIFHGGLKDKETQGPKQKPPSPAVALLTKELSSGKPRLATELKELADAQGISDTQLSYAKRKIGIADGKLDGKHSYWFTSSSEVEECTNTPS